MVLLFDNVYLQLFNYTNGGHVNDLRIEAHKCATNTQPAWVWEQLALQCGKNKETALSLHASVKMAITTRISLHFQ